MKFVCDSCSARYFVDDKKVAGKTVHVRCKRCGHVIRVSGLRPAQSNAARAPMAVQAAVGTGAQQRVAESVRSGPLPSAAPKSTPQTVEWHYSVNGHSFGPFNEGDLVAKFLSGQLGDETYVWNAEMADWRAAYDVPDFNPALLEARQRHPQSVTLGVPDSALERPAAEQAAADAAALDLEAALADKTVIDPGRDPALAEPSATEQPSADSPPTEAMQRAGEAAPTASPTAGSSALLTPSSEGLAAVFPRPSGSFPRAPTGDALEASTGGFPSLRSEGSPAAGHASVSAPVEAESDSRFEALERLRSLRARLLGDSADLASVSGPAVDLGRPPRPAPTPTSASDAEAPAVAEPPTVTESDEGTEVAAERREDTAAAGPEPAAAVDLTPTPVPEELQSPAYFHDVVTAVGKPSSATLAALGQREDTAEQTAAPEPAAPTGDEGPTEPAVVMAEPALAGDEHDPDVAAIPAIDEAAQPEPVDAPAPEAAAVPEPVERPDAEPLLDEHPDLANVEEAFFSTEAAVPEEHEDFEDRADQPPQRSAAVDTQAMVQIKQVQQRGRAKRWAGIGLLAGVTALAVLFLPSLMQDTERTHSLDRIEAVDFGSRPEPPTPPTSAPAIQAELGQLNLTAAVNLANSEVIRAAVRGLDQSDHAASELSAAPNEREEPDAGRSEHRSERSERAVVDSADPVAVTEGSGGPSIFSRLSGRTVNIERERTAMEIEAEQPRQQHSRSVGSDYFDEDLDRVRRAVQRCHELQLRESSEMPFVRVVLDITVRPDGAVSIDMEEQLATSTFGRCMQTRYSAWTFRTFEGEAVTLQRTYALQ